MDKTTIKDCINFLDDKLNLEKSNWKRLSRKKVGDIWVMVFECPVNNLNVELIEGREGLEISKLINTLNLLTSPSALIKTPAELEIDELTSEFRKCFIECSWENLFDEHIEMKGKTEEFKTFLSFSPQSSNEIIIWERLNALCKNVIQLDNDSLSSMLNTLIKNCYDPLSSIADKINEGMQSLSELASSRAIEAIGYEFSLDRFGLIQMLDVLERVLHHTFNNNLFKDEHISRLDTMVLQSQQVIEYEVDMLDYGYDLQHKQEIALLNGFSQRLSQYTYQEAIINFEKTKLLKQISPTDKELINRLHKI